MSSCRRTLNRFAYDDDGNTTSDGRWAMTWDAENRLLSMESHAGAPTGSRRRLEFAYDWMGRRISKVVSADTGSGWAQVSSTRFIYDGWNLIAELNGPTVVRSYVWGLDLSGSMQGAGGVGGLLAVTIGTNTHLPFYDGNGNVMGLVDATSGASTAQYEYGPFGEPIRVTGTAADDNPFRFSTKYTDGESEWVYYGYRYYKPKTGGWLSRDPIGEAGGISLYGFVSNNPQSFADVLGLADVGNSWLFIIPEGDPRYFKNLPNSSNPKGDALVLALYAAHTLLVMKDREIQSEPLKVAYADALRQMTPGEEAIFEFDLKPPGRAARYSDGGFLRDPTESRIDCELGWIVFAKVRRASEFTIVNGEFPPYPFAPSFYSSLFPQPGVDLTLTYGRIWTPEQRKEADKKAFSLTWAETFVTRNIVREGTSARARFQAAGGVIRSGNHVDHVQDLQLAGADVVANMQSLNSSVNTSMGKQIELKIRYLPEGTRINKVSMIERVR